MATVTVLVLVAGCGIFGGDSVQKQRETLQQRPTIEDIVIRYEQMTAQIRDRLSTLVPGLTWFQYNDGSRRGCGFEFPDVPEGESRSLPGWVAKGGISDEYWDEAVAIVWDMTGQHGFGTPEVIVSEPGHHRLVIRDPYGGTLNFGTTVNAVMQMHTGCHLPAGFLSST